MIIDSHQHFWKFDPVRDAWIDDSMRTIQRDFLPGDLKPILDQNGIEAVVSVQADQSEEETMFLIKCAEHNPFVKAVVGWTDLLAESLEDRLDHFKQWPVLKGFRHIVQGEAPGFLDNPNFVNGVRKLSRYGYTYDLLIYHYQLEESIRFVAKLPDSKIVIDHIAKPPIKSGGIKEWRENIVQMAKIPNVFCKISGMVTEAHWSQWRKDDILPYLDVVLEAFGSSRIMYGSDWPVCLLAAAYTDQLGLVTDFINKLSDNERKAIMGGNAIKFYNIDC